MEATRKIDLWKAIAFLVLSFYFTACFDSCNEPLPPTIKPVVIIQPAENITVNSATLVAQVIANSDSATVAFIYAESNGDWKTIPLKLKFNGSEPQRVTLDLGELKASTVYSVKVSAVNSAGSVTSSVIKFTTMSEPVLAKAVIITNNATEITKTSATLSATIIANQDQTAYFCDYQVKNGVWQTLDGSQIISGSDSTKVSFNLTNLNVNTDYNFRFRALNIAGETISSLRSFRTYAVSDYDGNNYYIVTIGNQTWLQENFKGTHFANGDLIPNITDVTTWANLTTGAYVNYNNDETYVKTYGRLYNWYVGADPRGLIVDWHVPTIDECITLSNWLGGYVYDGIAAMEAGHAHWGTTARVATNSSGFTALPNGGFAVSSATYTYQFFGITESAAFWSSSETRSFGRSIDIEAYTCGFDMGILWNKNYGLGLRLIKN